MPSPRMEPASLLSLQAASVVVAAEQGKFATAANPLGFHVLAWTVPLEAMPQPLPAKARTPNHFAQGRCRANTPMFGAGGWI
jgi:hypothetical protein